MRHTIRPDQQSRLGHRANRLPALRTTRVAPPRRRQLVGDEISGNKRQVGREQRHATIHLTFHAKTGPRRGSVKFRYTQPSWDPEISQHTLLERRLRPHPNPTTPERRPDPDRPSGLARQPAHLRSRTPSLGGRSPATFPRIRQTAAPCSPIANAKEAFRTSSREPRPYSSRRPRHGALYATLHHRSQTRRSALALPLRLK